MDTLPPFLLYLHDAHLIIDMPLQIINIHQNWVRNHPILSSCAQQLFCSEEGERERERERGFMHQSPMKPLKRFHRAWVNIHDLCYICLLSFSFFFFLVLFFSLNGLQLMMRCMLERTRMNEYYQTPKNKKLRN